MAVPVRSELLVRVGECATRVVRCMTRTLEAFEKDVRNLGRALAEPQRIVEEAAQRLDDRIERASRALRVLLDARARELARCAAKLTTPRQLIRIKTDRFETVFRNARRAMDALLTEKKTALRNIDRVLESVSYQRVLDRGFALVTDEHGQAITEAAAVQAGMELDIRFRDGTVSAAATGGDKARHKPKSRGAKKGDKQGTLL